MDVELRCGGRIHGKIADGQIEVKCRSKACGATAGVVVMHYFDLATGQLVNTTFFADPAYFFERSRNGDIAHHP